MGRPEKPLDTVGEIAAFAAELRQMKAAVPGMTYREIAARSHFSRATLAAATNGRQMPTLPVVLAIVEACGGEPALWRRRWEKARRRSSNAAVVLPALPEQPLADGAEPEAAGCGADATTAIARKVLRNDFRLNLGQIELRFSARQGAAWARFEGYASLDALAQRNAIEVHVQIARESDNARTSVTEPYCFDYHWCDVLLIHGSRLQAGVSVIADGIKIAEGTTPWWSGVGASSARRAALDF